MYYLGISQDMAACIGYKTELSEESGNGYYGRWIN